ncbi:flavodoxin family protein [Terrisporobacter sp.]
MKNLVVFYSLEGNTKFIASEIAKKVNADILELKTKKEYPKKGFRKFFWGGRSVIFNQKPELIEYDKNINKYYNIFIGTPIWVGTYAPPYNTFLAENKIDGKNIYLFACHGGGGAEKFYNNIKKEIPNNNFVSEIDFNEPLNNDKEEALKKVDSWLDDLKNNNKK